MSHIDLAEQHLSKNDAIMKKLIEAHNPCTILQSKETHYHHLVATIISQQLSVKAAESIEKKLKIFLGEDSFEPEPLLDAQYDQLRTCGLSGSKINYIKNVAEFIRDGQLNLEALSTMPDAEIVTQLTEIKGIGQWTADIFLMFSMKRLDVLPLGDLALRRAMQQLYGISEKAPHKHYHQIAKHWEPYRSIASWYCWAHVD